MREPKVLDRPAAPPNGFSLQDFADQSFGIYHDDVEDVVLRISPARARDALNWRFHVRQTVEMQSDGTALVRFSASGMRELAWHLFTWGKDVEILSPPEPEGPDGRAAQGRPGRPYDLAVLTGRGFRAT